MGLKEITCACIQIVREINIDEDMGFEHESSDEASDNRDMNSDYTAQN